nr:MAG TPA: hypothetical protein [Caudoviricetes sp.]
MLKLFGSPFMYLLYSSIPPAFYIILFLAAFQALTSLFILLFSELPYKSS